MEKKEISKIRRTIKAKKDDIERLAIGLAASASADVCSLSRQLIATANELLELQAALNSVTSDVDEKTLFVRSQRRLKRKEREARK